MGDLAWERNLFFPKPLVKEFFPGIQPCTIFLQHYKSLNVFSARFFFPRKQSAGYFFSEITYTLPPPPPAPQSQMVGPVGTGDRSQKS